MDVVEEATEDVREALGEPDEDGDDDLGSILRDWKVYVL